MTGIVELFAGRPLVAILRGLPAAEAVRLAGAVWDTGIGVVEVPIQTPDAVASLAAVAAAARERGERCGAGTVVCVQQVSTAATAGAAFTVSPGFDPVVLSASERAGLPHLPGVATASEIQHAVGAGCTWFKMFPASSLRPSWLREMGGPFPQARFVATGGIDAGNAAEFLRAGAAALGVGSAVARPGGLDALAEVIAQVNLSR